MMKEKRNERRGCKYKAQWLAILSAISYLVYFIGYLVR